MISIHSISSSRELRLIGEDDDYFTAELLGYGVSAQVTGIFRFPPCGDIAAFFESLVAHASPWSATLSWESLDGEFILSASCDANGHVLFTARLSGLLGGVEEWHVSAQIPSELGALPELVRAARAHSVGLRA